MLNYNNSTEYLKIFNRNKLEKIDKLTFCIEGKKYIDCKVISITPRYIYFDCDQLKINQTGRYEYILITNEGIEVDKGIINLDFPVKTLTTTNNIINYGTKQ